MHSNLHATSVTGNTSHHVTRDPVFYPKCVSSKTSCTDHADEGKKKRWKGGRKPFDLIMILMRANEDPSTNMKRGK